MTTDRRASPRKSMRFLVQHQAGVEESFDVDYATDLSLSGIFVSTKKVLPVAATLHVQFAPGKDARLVSTFARVARVTPEGAAMQFVSLDAESAQLIDAALA